MDVATVLSQLGCVAVSETVLTAANRGADLGPDAQRQLDAMPGITRHLLQQIPRLDAVLEIIAYHDKAFDAPARFSQEKCGKDIPFGARVLKATYDFDTLQARGLPEPEALDRLASRSGRYDPDILAALKSLICREEQPEVVEVSIGKLVSGMVLAEDLHNDSGVLLLKRGNPITEPLKRRLESTAMSGQSPKQIRVFTPRLAQT